MSAPVNLPRVARAYAYYHESLLARLRRLYAVEGITRTFRSQSGDVDLVIQWRDDETRELYRARATSDAFEHLMWLGFSVVTVGFGPTWHIRLKGYHGDRRALEVPADEMAVAS